MANYAIRLPRLSAAEWAGRVPLSDNAQKIYYEDNPDIAFQTWLDEMRASLSNREGLFKLYDLLRRQYLRYQAEEGPFATPWIEWLSQRDPNWYLATLPPALKGVIAERWSRPLRWYSFA